MNTKYKVGIENHEFLAICKLDSNELVYNKDKITGLKQYLTRKGISTDSPLDYFDIVPNPYRNTPKCNCRLCEASYKDPTNKSGQLTLHIQKRHNMSIKDYTDRFPEDNHLFEYKIKELSRTDKDITEEKDRIQCPICNKYFKAIKYSHTKTHGMTLGEFRQATGLTDLQSISSKERSKELYYSNGLSEYKKPSKPKPEKIKKNKSRKSIKEYVSGVDYTTYNTEQLTKEGCEFIYRLTFPSNKCYIGRTNNFFKRMASHKRKAISKSKFAVHCAIRKYGWDSVIKEVIDIVTSNEEAKVKERYWIDFFDSYYNGYNNTLSTEGGHTWEGKKDTQQYLDYIEKSSKSAKAKGKYVFSEEALTEMKAKMSAKAKGRHTLPWFKSKYGELQGKIEYDKRSEKLRSRRDQIKDPLGRFTPTKEALAVI